jgi:hypothetical protein
VQGVRHEKARAVCPGKTKKEYAAQTKKFKSHLPMLIT